MHRPTTRPAVLISSLIIAAALASGTAQAGLLVAPPGAEFFDPPGADCFLFSSCGNTAYRNQTIYDASNFGGRSGYIGSIAFREDAVGAGSTTSFIIDVVIANAARNSSNMSYTFAENIGSNSQTVYSGELTFSLPRRNSGTELQPFLSVIRFDTPWFHDGVSNLILDYRVSEYLGSEVILFDAMPNGTAGMESRIIPNRVNAPTTEGWGASHDGHVAQFEFVDVPPTSVPGPSGLMLALLGLLGLSVTQRRRLAAAVVQRSRA